MGSFVIILSLCMHSYARPYEEYLIDMVEFVSLLSTLLIFQMGMVRTFPQSSQRARESEGARARARARKWEPERARDDGCCNSPSSLFCCRRQVWQAEEVDPDGQLAKVLEQFALILVLLTSGLGFLVEVKMFMMPHDDDLDELAEREFDNPLTDLGDTEAKAQSLIDLRDAASTLASST